MSTPTSAPAGSPKAKEATMFHADALFTSVSDIDRQLLAVQQLEEALAKGKRVVHMIGSWQTYRGRREIEQSLAARKAWLAEVGR